MTGANAPNGTTAGAWQLVHQHGGAGNSVDVGEVAVCIDVSDCAHVQDEVGVAAFERTSSN